MRRERSDLTSFSQLVQDLINGSVRRHIFTQCELELLLDLQTSRLRKSSKPEALRRYLKAVHQQFASESSILRFSAFVNRDNVARLSVQSASLPAPFTQTAA